MSDSLEPYIDVIRMQLTSSLVARDESSKKAALYTYRMLTTLGIRSTVLPSLQAKALEEIELLLDVLLAEISGIPGGLILLPPLNLHIRARPDYDLAQPFLQRAVQLLAEQPNPSRSRLMSEIAGITCRIQESFKQAVVEQDLMAVGDRSPHKTLDATQRQSLRDYLRKTFADEHDVEIGTITSVLGGASKLTLIVELKNSYKLPSSVVLRIDNAKGVTDTTVADEFNLIKAVHAAGVLAPRPFAIENDDSVLGSPFIIVSKMEGHNIGDWIEVLEPTKNFAVGVARTLAKLHAIPIDPVGRHLPGANTTTHEYLMQGLSMREKTWRAYGEPSIAMELAIAWIKAHMAFAEGRRTIVHCDVGCHNMLGNNGELTALLDWETAIIDNPAHDLAYTFPMIIQMMPWDDYLAEYQNAGGVLPTEREMDFYRVWCSLFKIHFMFMVRSYFFSGSSSSLIHAYSSQHLYLHLDCELHQEVKRVYEKYQGC